MKVSRELKDKRELEEKVDTVGIVPGEMGTIGWNRAGNGDGDGNVD